MRVRIVAVVAVMLFFSACQTDRSESNLASGSKDPAGGVSADYNVFYDQSDHVKKLLKAGEIEEASRVYDDENAFFHGKGNTYNDLKAELRVSVAELVHPELEDATKQLAKLVWPAPRLSWSVVAEDIKTLRQAIEDAESHLILVEGAEDPVVVAAERQLADTERKIREGADLVFRQMGIFSIEAFADIYPLPVDIDGLFERNKTYISRAVATARTTQLEGFRERYSTNIDHILSGELAHAYVSALEREQIGQGKSKLAAYIESIKSAGEKGFQIGRLEKGSASIRVVDITSQTLSEAGEIQFSIGLDLDLPLDVEKADLDAALSKRAGSKVDVLILIDVAAARTNRDVERMEKGSSQFIAGSRTMPNPKYATAQNNVTIAQTNFNTSNLEKLTRRPNDTTGLFWQLLRNLQNKPPERTPKQKLEDALADLAATPMMVEVPIFRAYQFERAYVHAVKTAVVHYYVINRSSNSFVKGTFDAEETRDFRILYGLRGDDRNLDDITSNAHSQAEVAAFERRALTVSLADILNEYTNARIAPKPLPSQADLRREIVHDKNIVLAKFQKERVRPVHDAGRDGKRMASVVRVGVGSNSHGSGFYINDSTVLTNYHVVNENRFVDIQLSNGTETFGKVVAHDARVDLALIKVQHRGSPVTFMNLVKVPIGATVQVLGSPREYDFSVSQGIISAVRKWGSAVARGGNKITFIQTDAAINPGNSGGPMFLGNNVVGVSDWGRRESEGLNFAIHVSEVVKFLRRHNENFNIVEGDR